MFYNTRMRFLALGGIVAALGFSAWFFLGASEPVTPLIVASQSAAVNTLTDIVTEPAPPLGPLYRNRQYGFSLNMPEGFVAAELPFDGTGQATTLQDQQGNGIQIYITPDVGKARSISARDVSSQIPDMQVVNAQDVEIGDDYRGVAFMSDNEAFAGASREVWFVFRGNLYQISTYARLDPLLQAMFGTWKFE